MQKRTYNGAFNNKERSMQKLLDAVGVVIRTDGYTGLSASNIARHAGLSRKLIATYFDTTENLIEQYVRSKDYWADANGPAVELMKERNHTDTRELLESLLLNQFDYFFEEEEMQKIVLWQLSERSKVMYDVCEERERLGAGFFQLADPFFKDSGVDIRAVSGLLVAGIYYMILHAKVNDSLFCQIDVNSKEGRDRIKHTVAQILEDSYKRAESHHRH